MASKTIYKNANGVNAEVTLINPDTNFNKRTVELNSIMDKTPTIATLRAKTEIPETIYVTGYHSEGDGAFGSNIFRWNSTSTEDDNGGTVIKLDGVETGRYELQYDGAVNVKWFGAKGDGVTDDTAAIQSLLSIDYLVDVYFEKNLIYSINDEIVIPNGVHINLQQSIINFYIEGNTKGFVLGNNSSIFNGEVNVISVTGSSGPGMYLACILGGDQITGEGVFNAHVYDLKVSTTRVGGNGILFTGDSNNCSVRNIEYPDSTTIGQVIALEWGGKGLIDTETKHPHNITIDNIKTGKLTGSHNATIWLSSVFNTKVTNIFSEQANIVVGVSTGDASNDYADIDYKYLVSKGIELTNVSCSLVDGYGIRVYGLASLAIDGTPYPRNIISQSVTINNPTLIGSGVSNTSVGISLTACQDITINNPSISKMGTGFNHGQQVLNVKINGGSIFNNRKNGLDIGDSTVPCKNISVEKTEIYNNNAGGAGGYGITINNAINTDIRLCKFGRIGETQQNSIRILSTTAINTRLNDNHTYYLNGSSAYANGLVVDYDMHTYGENNTADITGNYYFGTPLYKSIWRGRREFTISGNTPPTSGSWVVGDRCFYDVPFPGGSIGAVCTASGTPGTWKTFGAITA